MLKMTAQEGLREAIARQALLEQLGASTTSYNTGDAVHVNDANEYIGLIVANLRPGLNLQNGPVQIYGMAATGAVNAWLVVQLTSNRTKSCVPVPPPANIVDTVRKTFRLTISDTAQVLCVSRPTVYQWESLTDIEAIRAHNDRDRLKRLYLIALDWSKHTPPRGRWLHAALPNGKSVFDLLCETNLSEEAVSRARDILVAMGPHLQADENRRATGAVKSMKGAFAKLAANEKERAGRG